MTPDQLRQIDAEIIREFQEDIAYLQKIIDNPKTGPSLKKQCLKIIKKGQRYIRAIETGEIDKKTAFCEYCGEPYNPEWTLLHGDKHLLLSIRRYDKKTGKE